MPRLVRLAADHDRHLVLTRRSGRESGDIPPVAARRDPPDANDRDFFRHPGLHRGRGVDAGARDRRNVQPSMHRFAPGLTRLKARRYRAGAHWPNLLFVWSSR